MITDKYGRVAGSIDLATLADMYTQATDEDLKAHYRQVAAENGLDLGAAAEQPAESPVEAPAEDLSGLSKTELLNRAHDAGVDGADSMTKAQLVYALGG